MANPWGVHENPGEVGGGPISRQFKRAPGEEYLSGESPKKAQGIVSPKPNTPILAKTRNGERKLVTRGEAGRKGYEYESDVTDGAVDAIQEKSEFLGKLQEALSRYRNAKKMFAGDERERELIRSIQAAIDTNGPIEVDKRLPKSDMFLRLSPSGRELIRAYLQACLVAPYESLPEPSDSKQSALRQLDKLQASLDKQTRSFPTPAGMKSTRTIRAQTEKPPIVTVSFGVISR